MALLVMSTIAGFAEVIGPISFKVPGSPPANINRMSLEDVPIHSTSSRNGEV